MTKNAVLKATSVGVRIKVLYFARLKEALGRGSEDMVLTGEAATVDTLRAQLRLRGGVWETELAQSRAVRAAVNQDMATLETTLSDGDEVAFFPPVTGG